MRNPPLQARFFVTRRGVAIPKDRPANPNLRRAVFDRDGWRCRQCRRQVAWRKHYAWPIEGDPIGHADHIFPRARGGRTTLDNLQLLCERCNSAKAAD